MTVKIAELCQASYKSPYYTPSLTCASSFKQSYSAVRKLGDVVSCEEFLKCQVKEVVRDFSSSIEGGDSIKKTKVIEIRQHQIIVENDLLLFHTLKSNSG